MNSLTSIGIVLALAGAASQVHAQAPAAASRGQLLYTTHCVSCHTDQVHWRNGRQAINWDSLVAQVRRWQGNARLQWGEADITEVARHLNETIYHFPQTGERLSMAVTRSQGRD
jgi:hypothetical protein